eukprot:scaffold85642_cov63-Attheya_sp.AAC.1
MPSFSEKLKNFDTQSSVSNEFRVRTAQGAAFSVTTLIAISYLIYTELVYNLSASVRDRVHVNATSPAGLELEFDVTFPSVPCALLSVDANDPTGQPQSMHIDREHHVWKHRMDKTGRMIGKRSKFELGNTLQSETHLKDTLKEAGLGDTTEETHDDHLHDEHDDQFHEHDDIAEECGSCYGAGEEGDCCQTCDDVKRMYTLKGWGLNNMAEIEQCKHTITSEDEKGEGCNVHGVVALSTGGGNLHLAPSRDLENAGKKHLDFFASMQQLIENTFEQFNVSHTIHTFRFGPDYPGVIHQLDGKVHNIEDAYGMYQYYIQVVPTLYRYLNGTQQQSYQYSVTEHMRHVTPGSGRGLPGLFFFYEVSALHVEIEEYRRGWIHFFTGVCAVVGGVFTVMGVMDKIVFTKMNEKNHRGGVLAR